MSLKQRRTRPARIELLSWNMHKDLIGQQSARPLERLWRPGEANRSYARPEQELRQLAREARIISHNQDRLSCIAHDGILYAVSVNSVCTHTQMALHTSTICVSKEVSHELLTV
jgi:hypothetical protein